MIPGITENFPSYATLHQATISFEEMGGRTITTQVKIDGDVTPDFSSSQWSLEYNGELFTLNTHTPQATKDNSTRCSLIDLTFESTPIQKLKQYFFVELSQVQVGTMIINRFVASLRVKAEDFIVAFGRVLEFYFGNTFTIEIASGTQMPQEIKEVELNYTYLWEALANLYNVYGLVWRFAPTTGGYKIVVGDTVGSINDHIFQYGYSGGLQKIERQLEDAEIYNQLFGRGGEKNLPYRYFKKVDPNNEYFAGDPDACKELETVYFDRLLDSNFRYYVKGWLRNPCPARQASIAEYPIPSYDEPQEIQDHWAYQKGLTDVKFDPVEYVQDLESIVEYGIRQGKLDDDDEIYPTIQGITVSPYGRIDETVAISTITDGDDSGAIGGVKTESLPTIETRFTNYSSPGIFNPRLGKAREIEVDGNSFYVQEGFQGRIEYSALFFEDYSWFPAEIRPATNNAAKVSFSNWEITAIRDSDNASFAAETYIPGGASYHLHIKIHADIINPNVGYCWQVGIQNVVLISKVEGYDDASNSQTFRIWVKNIWNSTQLLGESNIAYAERVWLPILGDMQGNEAKVVFSDGALAASSDWDFTIIGVPVVDRTKSINGVQSEWCITLAKNDSELEATGKLIPNSTSAKPVAGDHFFFTGIDMPHYYVELAEKRLNEKKQEALDTKAYSNPTWAVQLDPVRINTLESSETVTLMSRLNVGVAIKIYDPRFTGGQTLTLTIRTMNIVWSEGTVMKPSVEIVLSENVLARSSASQTLSPTSIQARIQDAVNAATESIWISMGTAPYVTQKTEQNVYSNKNFLSGATFGNYVGGLAGTGAKIDSEGHAEMDSLTLRKFLEVPELRFNRVDVQVGNYWRAPGGGLIERVEIDYNGTTPLTTGTIYLKLEEGELASVAIDDICMGIFHSESGNAEADTDDSQGNFHFAGFSTCYFRITDILAADGHIFKYALRPASALPGWNESNHPQESMTFVAYGNFSDTSRQTSRYSTRTYERYLRGVNNWQITKDNIAAQFGDLSNLSVFGMNMTGYSAYLENIYMSGYIRQTSGLPSPHITFDTGGRSGLSTGEQLTLACSAYQGWESIASRVQSWSIARDSGDATADAQWQQLTKVQAFNGTIIIENGLLSSDLSQTLPTTLFTITATLTDGTAVYGTIAIARIQDGIDGDDAVMIVLDHYSDVMLYDSDGNRIGNTVEVDAKLYKGGQDITSQATNWAYTASGCTCSQTANNFVVTAMSSTNATLTIRCNFGGEQYSAIFSLTKILSGDRYEIETDVDSIIYNTTTHVASDSEITYSIYKVSQNASGALTRTLLQTLDTAKFIFYVGGVDRASSYVGGEYVYTVSNFNAGGVSASIIRRPSYTVAKSSVPIIKSADGEVGVTYRMSVWKANTQYRNDTNAPGADGHRIIDIVYNKDVAMMNDPDLGIFQCVTAHTSQEGDIDPDDPSVYDPSLWSPISQLTQPLATPLLLANQIKADYIDVQNLAANSAFVNALEVKKLIVKDGNNTIGVMGDLTPYVIGTTTKKYPFWIGAATPESAVTRIDADGNLTTTGGKIGDFSIISGRLSASTTVSNATANLNIYANYISYSANEPAATGNAAISAGVEVGVLASNLYNPIMGMVNISLSRRSTPQITQFQNMGINLNISGNGSGVTNYGIYASVSGSGGKKYGISVSASGTGENRGLSISADGGTSNYGIYCSNGLFAGLRPQTKIITATGLTLSAMDFSVAVNNSTAWTLNLPASPQEGQTYFIHHISATSLTINGNGHKIYYMRNGSTQDSQASTSIEIGILTYFSDFSLSGVQGVWILHFLHL